MPLSRRVIKPLSRRVIVPRDFDRWRQIARALLQADVPPGAIVWEEAAAAQSDLFGSAGSETDTIDAELAVGVPDESRRVSRDFLRLARLVSAHADRERHALLYRVLWRLTHAEPHLLDVSVDPDVLALHVRERAVRRAAHKTKAFVRFRRVEDAEGERFVAWIDPEHDVLPLVGAFFARRFPAMAWAILTPIRTAIWDRTALVFAPGEPRDAAPADDELDALWRTYYAGIFNPARVKVRAMQREMPKRWWSDLPEARLIPGLLRDAPARVAAMHARAAEEAAALAQGEAPRRGKRRRAGWSEPDARAPDDPRSPGGGARLATFGDQDPPHPTMDDDVGPGVDAVDHPEEYS